MKAAAKYILKILMGFCLLLQVTPGLAANLRFVAVFYDLVTYQSVPGKVVEFSVQQLATQQVVFQQTYTTSANGEVITPYVTLNDSVWYRYHFAVTDCKNDSVVFSDSLQALQNDTIFLYFGICHSALPGSCLSQFSYAIDTLNPLQVSFTDLSTGNPSSWLWSFGDGTSSTLHHPVKSYTAPGLYFACLTIKDSATLCHHTWCDLVNLTGGISVAAGFTHQIDSFNVMPRVIRLYDQTQSNVPLTLYHWDFGDGDTSMQTHPVHQYLVSGQYLVCLKVGSTAGYYDSTCQQVTVPGYHNLWGQAFAGNNTMLTGQVELRNAASKHLDLLDIAVVDNYGLYYFAQRIEHDYTLRVMPDRNDPLYADFLPTYAGNALHWQEAATLTLSGDIVNYDISLVKKKLISAGTCHIDGKVQLASGVPSGEGVLVILFSMPDYTPVGFTYTDSAGWFYLDQLPFGSYLLMAEEPGYQSMNILLTLSAQYAVYNNLLIGLSDVTPGITEPTGAPMLSVTPNPASDYLTITLQAGQEPILWVIHNTEGKQWLGQEMEASQSNYTVDIRSLPAGLYTLTVITRESSSTMKFIRME